MASTINLALYSDALVVLGTAGVVVPLVRYAGLNPVIGYLGAGALLGPLGLGTFIDKLPFLYWVTVVDAGNVSGIADLGVVFLLFLIGLELSYERLLSMRKLVFGLGGLQVLLTSAVLTAIIAAAGEKTSAALILGACLSLSSTAIALEILAGQGKLKAGVGRVSFSILLAQDLAVIPILILVSILGADAGGSVVTSIAKALGNGAAAVAAIVLIGKSVLQPLFRVVGSIKSNELFTAAVLFVIIGTGVLAAIAGLSMALGAFVAGLLIAETEYRKAVEAIVEPFKGLLLGIFFFTVGMTIDLRELLREPMAIVSVVLGVIGLKAAIIVILSRLFGQSWSTAVETGFLLGPGGEFAFVVVGLASKSRLLDPELSSFVTAATSVGMTLIPMLSHLATRASAHFVPPKPQNPALGVRPRQERKHAIVVGHGRVGKVVASLLHLHQLPFIVTDNDADAVTMDRQEGCDVYFGDAVNPGFLEACGIHEAAAVIITMGSAPTIDAIVNSVRRLRPDVLIVARARDTQHAQHLYEIGVSNAVPETVEASLQISEAALIGLGIPDGVVRFSVEKKRQSFHDAIQAAVRQAIGQDRDDAPAPAAPREGEKQTDRATDASVSVAPEAQSG